MLGLLLALLGFPSLTPEALLTRTLRSLGALIRWSLTAVPRILLTTLSTVGTLVRQAARLKSGVRTIRFTFTMHCCPTLSTLTLATDFRKTYFTFDALLDAVSVILLITACKAQRTGWLLR